MKKLYILLAVNTSLGVLSTFLRIANSLFIKSFALTIFCFVLSLIFFFGAILFLILILREKRKSQNNE